MKKPIKDILITAAGFTLASAVVIPLWELAKVLVFGMIDDEEEEEGEL